MTPAQLRAFVAVADSGSVRAAADRLVVTQPAVSAALRALQRSLGVRLVEPHGRGLRLTGAGAAFASYARQALGLLAEAELAARGGQDPARGALRIAAVTTPSEHVLPRALARFRARYPKVGIALEVGNRQHVWALLEQYRVDVVIAGRPPAGRDLVVRALCPNELVVVSAPNRETAREDPLAPRDLETRTWLLREPGSGTRAAVEAFLATYELDPPRLVLGSNGAVVAGAVAGLGVTLAHRDALARETSTGELAVLSVEGTPLQRPWHVVTHPRTTATAELFLSHLLDAESHPAPRFHRPGGHSATRLHV